MKILIVDDQYLIRKSLEELLKFNGHQLISAASVKEALEVIENETFDVAIIDFSMPDGEGTEVVSLVKKTRSETKVLGMSGYEKEIAFYRAGADFFIRKPIEVEELLKMIASIE